MSFNAKIELGTIYR